MEITMCYRLSIAAAAALMLGGVGATAAELPTYEVMGFPITPHQLVALGPADAEQGLPASTLTKAGMPASPHQIAVLTPRQTADCQQRRASSYRAGPALPGCRDRASALAPRGVWPPMGRRAAKLEPFRFWNQSQGLFLFMRFFARTGIWPRITRHASFGKRFT